MSEVDTVDAVDSCFFSKGTFRDTLKLNFKLLFAEVIIVNDINEKPFVLAVAGPTASGKTALAVQLAKEFDGEVISADSMQIYKGMDIATAKPSKEEMQGIPHHLIGFLERSQSFSAAQYADVARNCINDVLSRGKLPIIAGGTGLYISSLLDNVRFSESRETPKLREELSRFAAENGNDALHAKLSELDSDAAQQIHPNNLVRVIRAIEVCMTTGRKFSELKAESRSEASPYDSLIIGLNFNDRQKLYDRIDRRVDIMVENGLVEESKLIWNESGLRTAACAIGYKELIPYFEGQMPLDECIGIIKRETRRYAKRQLTWFRRNEEIQWLMLDEIEQSEKKLEKCKKCIAKHRKV